MACTEVDTNAPPSGTAFPTSTHQGGGYVRMEQNCCAPPMNGNILPSLWCSDVNANCHSIFNLKAINCIPLNHFLTTPLQIDIDANGHIISNVGKIFIGSSVDDGSGALLQVNGEINAQSYMLNAVEFATKTLTPPGQINFDNIYSIDGHPVTSFLPQGVDGSVQFNDDGAFDGDSYFIYNEIAHSLIVGLQQPSTPAWRFEVGGDINIVDPTLVPFAYRINGVPFAIMDANRTHIDLININTINGNPPGSGGGGGVTNPAGITGEIQFNSGGLFAANNQLFWDIMNSRLGIGTTTPRVNIDCTGDINANNCYFVNMVQFACNNGTGGINLSNVTNINGSANFKQTPWLSNIDGAGFNLANVHTIAVTGPDQISPATLSFMTAAKLRWAELLSNPEIGSNSGSDWSLVSYTDVGAVLSTTIQVKRSTGYVGIGKSGPLYPMDIVGSVNSTGCYLINAIPFACSDGAGGIILENITNITGSMQVQTPWLSNINAAGFNLYNVGRIGVGLANPAYPLDVVGNANVSGCYLVATVPFACTNGSGGVNLTNVTNINGAPVFSQTPWLSDINGAGFRLISAGSIGIGIANPLFQLDVAGNVNATGCYYIQGTTFACSNGAGGINISNITNINGSPPFSQTPWLQNINGNNFSLTNTSQIGIGTSSPGYPLHVIGNVNSTGCYLINGVVFACSDGGTGVNLSNITNINGLPFTGGGASMRPISGSISIAVNAILDLRPATAGLYRDLTISQKAGTEQGTYDGVTFTYSDTTGIYGGAASAIGFAMLNTSGNVETFFWCGVEWS